MVDYLSRYFSHLFSPAGKDRIGGRIGGVCRHRHVSNGRKGRWMVFEQTGSADTFVAKVGLKSRRKA